MNLCLIHHSALTFFALINVIIGGGNSSRKILLLRVFQILQRNATTLSIGIRVEEVHIKDSQFKKLPKKLK